MKIKTYEQACMFMLPLWRDFFYSTEELYQALREKGVSKSNASDWAFWFINS